MLKVPLPASKTSLKWRMTKEKEKPPKTKKEFFWGWKHEQKPCTIISHLQTWVQIPIPEFPGGTSVHTHCFLWVTNRKSNIKLGIISLFFSFLNHFYFSVSAIYTKDVPSRRNGGKNYSMQDMFAAIFPVTYLKLGVKITIWWG